MTKEELKEAIAATITENGQKSITATALANLLNEIVDAAGSGGSSSGVGSGVIGVNMDVDFDGSTGTYLASEVRAAAYASILECLMAGTACNVCMYGTGISAPSITTRLEGIEVDELVISLTIILGWVDNTPSVFSLLLNSDGSMKFLE